MAEKFKAGQPVIIRCAGRVDGKHGRIHDISWSSTLQRDLAQVRLDGETQLRTFGFERLEHEPDLKDILDADWAAAERAEYGLFYAANPGELGEHNPTLGTREWVR